MRALVLRSTLGAVVPGLLAGAVLTLVNAQALGSFLYGVSPFDLQTLVMAEAGILVAALVDSLVPVWRAVRIDPQIAMRAE